MDPVTDIVATLGPWPVLTFLIIKTVLESQRAKEAQNDENNPFAQHDRAIKRCEEDIQAIFKLLTTLKDRFSDTESRTARTENQLENKLANLEMRIEVLKTRLDYED